MASEKMVKVKFLKGNVGYECVMKELIAQVMEKRGQVEILGPGTPAPKPEPKKGKKREDEDE